MKDGLGVTLLYGGYVITAIVLAWLGDMSLDRALLYITLFVCAQNRWFGRDESPIGEPPRPKRSFMSRVRGD